MKQPIDLQEGIEKVRALADEIYRRGENADEFLPIGKVGPCCIYIAASHDHPMRPDGKEVHANPRDCFIQILEGAMQVFFVAVGEHHDVNPGEGISIGKGVEHWAHFPNLTIYLAIVDEGLSSEM